MDVLLYSRGRVPVIPTAQHVKMNVIDDLSPAASHIEDEFVPGLRNALRGGDICGAPHKMSQKFSIRITRIRNGRDVLFGNNKDVNGRFGMDVAEGDASLIGMNDIRFLRPRRNFTKYALFHIYTVRPGPAVFPNKHSTARAPLSTDALVFP